MMSNHHIERGSSQHLQLINLARPKEFPSFSKLPYDIRYLIWQQVLSCERHIQVELIAKKGMPYAPTWSDFDYIIQLKDNVTMNALFHTTCESRMVAHQFYRVQMPCEGFTCTGTLYLCPELDTVDIGLGRLEISARFAHDVWSVDPKKVGLVNISLAAPIDHWHFIPRIWDDAQLELLTCAIQRLERVTFDLPVIDNDYDDDLDPTLFERLHGAVPITANIAEFDRLKADPRSVQEDLKRVHLGPDDPRKGFHSFNLFLKALGISKDDLHVNWSFQVSFRDYDKSQDIRAARKLARLTQNFEMMKTGHNSMEEAKLKTPRDVDITPQPALGFWLFPLESLGSFDLDNRVPIKSVKEHKWNEDIVLDMTNYPPELCLYHLA